ncbi:MAG: hypothetical protein C0478_08000 [Planctomyces sp.]|nr:hypothetical protein [Planctomyces sp.]
MKSTMAESFPTAADASNLPSRRKGDARPLALLVGQLQSLSRRRWQRNVLQAFLGFLAIVLVAGLAMFFLDHFFSPPRGVRLVVVPAVVALLAIVFARRVVPSLNQREDIETLALYVEKQHEIDNDLVAALQFARMDHKRYGSRELSSAVIEYVDEFTPSLNVLDGFDWRPVRKVLLAAGLIALVWLGIACVAPQSTLVFLNRLALGDRSYPTRTNISGLRVNGEPIDPARPARLIQGETLSLEITTTGSIPISATFHARTSTGEAKVFELPPAAKASSDSTNGQTFQTEIPEVRQSLSGRVAAGDAWSDEFTIELVQRPVVEVSLTVEQPAYTRRREGSGQPARGQLQVAVLDGSRVTLEIASPAKPLKKVDVIIGDKKFALTPVREDVPLDKSKSGAASISEGTTPSTRWRIASGTPFDSVRENLRYQIVVEDRDGLGLAEPLAGMIRIKTDRPPRVAAAAISKLILPQAAPVVTWGATDDYSIGELRLAITIVSEAGQQRKSTQAIPLEQRGSLLRGKTPVDLSGMNLAKGDEIRVVVEAEDDRGELPPQVGSSEPLIFQVTDQSGILAGLLETDQQSARQLDAIIQRELGIGGAP